MHAILYILPVTDWKIKRIARSGIKGDEKMPEYRKNFKKIVHGFAYMNAPTIPHPQAAKFAGSKQDPGHPGFLMTRNSFLSYDAPTGWE